MPITLHWIISRFRIVCFPSVRVKLIHSWGNYLSYEFKWFNYMGKPLKWWTASIQNYCHMNWFDSNETESHRRLSPSLYTPRSPPSFYSHAFPPPHVYAAGWSFLSNQSDGQLVAGEGPLKVPGLLNPGLQNYGRLLELQRGQTTDADRALPGVRNGPSAPAGHS